jgi:hypothetical protein
VAVVSPVLKNAWRIDHQTLLVPESAFVEKPPRKKPGE